jgi:hypothetical protein
MQGFESRLSRQRYAPFYFMDPLPELFVWVLLPYRDAVGYDGDCLLSLTTVCFILNDHPQSSMFVACQIFFGLDCHSILLTDAQTFDLLPTKARSAHA